jgi:HEAT repeat protein
MPGLRGDAARALGRVSVDSEAVIRALAEALKDKYPPVREEAAQALSRAGTRAKPAVPDLIQALKDPSGGAAKAHSR